MKHVTEVVFWESSARGQTYAARCSCGWVGATREPMPDTANEEAAAHAAREDTDHATR